MTPVTPTDPFEIFVVHCRHNVDWAAERIRELRGKKRSPKREKLALRCRATPRWAAEEIVRLAGKIPDVNRRSG